MRNSLQRVQQLMQQLENLHRTTTTVLAESKRLLDALETESRRAPAPRPKRPRTASTRVPRPSRT